MSTFTYKITCPYCSHKFEWHEGKVGDKIYIHCNICGKEKLHPEDTESYVPSYPSCECGGWFEQTPDWAPFVCPQCQQEIEHHEVRKIVEVVENKD